jgi:hypothetical protein
MRFGTLILILSVLGGCVAVPHNKRYGDHLYFGFVRVKYTSDNNFIATEDVKALGLGFDGALFFGWRDSHYVFARPDECRVIIVVRDHADLASVEKIAKSTEGACITGSQASQALR